VGNGDAVAQTASAAFDLQPVKKPGTPGLLGKSLQATVDRLRTKHRVCGISLAILNDGHIHAVASGWANASERIEATPDTLFQIGSIGKTFTATLAMQLVDDGALDLDAPVHRYLPDFTTADPASAALTVRQLLTHTAGIDGDFFPPADADGTSEDYVRQMRALRQLHAPGATMSYCNAGFVVLTRIIEVLRRASWNELVISRICEPLGLTRVIARPTDALRFRMAVGHEPSVRGVWTPVARPYLPLSMAGAGAVLSMTASDLLRYAQAHMDGPQRKQSRRSILSRPGFRAMQTPQLALPPYSQNRYTHMGLGWFLDADLRQPKLMHDGATAQQFASLHMLPKQKLAFALLLNSPSPLLLREIRDAIFTELGGVPPVPRQALPSPIAFDCERYIGTYGGIAQRMFVSPAQRGHLRMKIESELFEATELTLRAVEPDVFAIVEKPQRNLDARVVFVGERRGRTEYLRIGLRMTRRSD